MKKALLGLLAPEDLLEPLLGDLERPDAVHNRLVVVRSGRTAPSPWVQNIWETPQYIEFSSISDASKKLRAIQRNWVLYSTNFHRRAELIQESLPPIRFRQFVFGSELPKAPLGSWTLLEENLLFASAKCESAFPNGELHFAENPNDPPSRAYLKLWELFTRLEIRPQPGVRCLDAGASPGGWTWVLSELGASVIAIDRSPLSEKLMRHPKVTFIKGDALSRKSLEHGPFAWIFSDVAGYPEKLFDWVLEMLELSPSSNFVCTLKFQGTKGYSIIKKFAAIPDSKLLHLFHNKHELTWIRLRSPAPTPPAEL